MRNDDATYLPAPKSRYILSVCPVLSCPVFIYKPENRAALRRTAIRLFLLHLVSHLVLSEEKVCQQEA